MTTSRPSTVRYIPREFEPDWAVAPGEMIQLALEDLRFTQADVAARASISAKHLNQVIKGHVPLSPEVAVALERVLGVSADHWLRLEATWQAHRARESAQMSFAGLSSWLRKFPEDVLRRRAIIDASAPVAERAESLLRFFQVADTEAFNRVWLAPQANYRRSQKFEIDAFATALWLRLAEVSAEAARDARPYDADKLRSVAREIPSLTREPVKIGFKKAQDLLREAGVLLVFEPEVAGTRITGASRWLASTHPVIALSGRHKFLDIFWFALLHEIGHVLLHPKRATYLDVERRNANDDADEQESAADSFAADLILGARLKAELREVSTAEELLELAQRAGVSPTMVAGQYAHVTGDWRTFGRLRERADLSVLA
ncbi:HigA family addiction module antitoxin [Cellulomonas fimi]|uniref:HigA family addiction module antitoxin n=1 Tax=Cellulomonas fimi TaxID=1708 RepID=UPI000A04E196|nr:HigA family addiction module antitoxin [Cellulomonas fimi]NNH06979.1 HigA family addiction module antidote protein [Cellulomonas fimi]